LSALAFLKQFVSDEKIRHLRIDRAKEFQSDETNLKEYFADNDVVLQLVFAYNRTMQARVKGAIGCVKQHS